MKARFALAFGTFALASCEGWTPHFITATNASRHPVHVSANFAGHRKEGDMVEPGGSIILSSFSGGEGGACIIVERNGKAFLYGTDYITRNAPSHSKVEIRDDGVWDVTKDRSGKVRPSGLRPQDPNYEC